METRVEDNLHSATFFGGDCQLPQGTGRPCAGFVRSSRTRQTRLSFADKNSREWTMIDNGLKSSRGIRET